MITQGVDAVLTIARAIRCRWRRRDRQHVKEDSKVHLGLFKRFTLQELQVATDNFRETNIVSQDAFGPMYKGKLADDSLVAVHRFSRESKMAGRGFQTDFDLMNYICFHRNILPVIGFCMTPKEQLLVYPFMANGNLASRLRGCSPSKPPLDWPTRMRIARGSARGLYFLHEFCDPKIIHGDIQPSRIYLNEEFEAAIGNFTLAIQMDYKDDHVIVDHIYGTYGCIAPEYLMYGELSEKIDVFGYGMTLLELITGQKAIEPDKDVFLKDRVERLLDEKMLNEIVDPNLQNNYVEEEVEALVQIALLCTRVTPEQRPKMSEVLRMLQGNGPAERWVEEELVLGIPLYRTFHAASDLSDSSDSDENENEKEFSQFHA